MAGQFSDEPVASAHDESSVAVEPVSFLSAGTRCVGDLFKPTGAGPFPVVILAAGLGGTRALKLDVFARRFAAAGFAAMTFDYRGFGESEGQPRQVVNIAAQRQDWRAAIAYAQSRKDLDADRVVLWGTSFAGGHVLQLAAERRDIAAVIAQCPFTDGQASVRATKPSISTVKVAVAAVADLVSDLLGRAPVLVEAAGEPGSAALMTAPDALPGYRRLIASGPPGTHTRVAARIGLTIGLDAPGRRLGDIAVPTLMQVCHPDTVAPDAATWRHIERANNPSITATTINAGHFDLYDGPVFEQTVAAQIRFLREHVGSVAA